MQYKFTIIVLIYLAATSFETVPVVDGANIVFFFAVSSYSHRVTAWPLIEALVDNGHNVTFVSSYPDKSTNSNPKIFDYVPQSLKEFAENLEGIYNVFEERKNGDKKNVLLMLPVFGIMTCEALYNDKDYVNWIKSTQVDVLVLNALANDCAYGMAEYWGAKVILFDTSAPFGYFLDVYGLPDETSWIPSLELSQPIDMSFLQRLTNALLPIVSHYHRKWNFFPKLEEITKTQLGVTNLTKFEELERSASLVFINTHYAEEFARSLPPNVIPVGGIAYTERRRALPKEMEAFLDKGDGFIYMSFGSYADFLKFDRSTQQTFIKTMQSLSHIQFLWKVQNETFIKEFPENNVFISKWMPQQDILAHPKILAFITHSGLISIQEAIQNSVPLISFPIFSEQDYNAERIHSREYGIRLEITTVTQPQLEEAIRNIVTDEKYRNNMKKVSTMFSERPQKPLETALWWTEFVIRHSKDDLLALRPLNVGQSWWKRRQLDVWITILGCIVAFLFLCVYILLKCVYCMKGSSAKTLQKPTPKKKVQ